jgi:hypothetical protein
MVRSGSGFVQCLLRMKSNAGRLAARLEER